MERLKRLTGFSLLIGVLTLVVLILSAFALTDIYHGTENDLRTEWHIVRWSHILLFVFIGLALFNLLIWRKR